MTEDEKPTDGSGPKPPTGTTGGQSIANPPPVPEGNQPAGSDPQPHKGLSNRLRKILTWASVVFIATTFLRFSEFGNNITSSYKNSMDVIYANRTATAGAILQMTSISETTVAKTEVAARAAQTQEELDRERVANDIQAEDEIQFETYYFCSRVLDLEDSGILALLNEKLSLKNLRLEKLMITPYWNSMYLTTGHEYLFVLLGNTGKTLVKPQDVTDISWEPSEYGPSDWIEKDTVRQNGNFRPGAAHALLVADRLITFGAPVIPTDPFISPGDPQIEPAIPSDSSNTGPFSRCLNLSNWPFSEIRFTVNYISGNNLIQRPLAVNVSQGGTTKELTVPPEN